MSILDAILAHKREEVEADKKTTPVARLKEMSGFTRPCISLEPALRARRPAIIAEIKKASPSKQVIRKEFDPVMIAREYQEAGASAISVLTDAKFFQGSLAHLDAIRESVSIPILRKDFIIDAYQLYESKAHGADVVLLIAAAIEKGRLHDLYDEAHAIGLESLVEVHSEEELRSLHLENIRLLGVNNRDLSTFETDLATSFRLKELVPPSVVLVSESGIATRGDVDRLMEHGIHAMLVGESLMRAPSPGKALAALLGRTEAMAR